MALTLADYQSLVKGMVGEGRSLTSRIFPDADITAALNSAQARFLMELNSDFFKTATTVDATTGDISVPADFLGHLTLTLVVNSASDRRVLLRREAQALEQENPNWRWQTATYPTHYVVQSGVSGWTYRLYPQPTATITDGLYVRYTPEPTDMSDASDTSQVASLFPHRERHLLPYGACADLLMFEAGGADDQAMKFESVFQRTIMQCRSDLALMFASNSTYGGR